MFRGLYVCNIRKILTLCYAAAHFFVSVKHSGAVRQFSFLQAVGRPLLNTPKKKTAFPF